MAGKGQKQNKIYLFQRWQKRNNQEDNVEAVERATIALLGLLGIPCTSVFSETDALKIRLMASELVVKRGFLSGTDVKTYFAAIRFLITYAEALEEDQGKKITAEKENNSYTTMSNQAEKSNTKDTLIVAYYLSRVNKEAVRRLGYRTMIEAFNGLSIVLHQKASTIKNMRDEFDPYFDNGRVGWYQRPLRASRQEVFDALASKTDEDLFQLVNSILTRYSSILEEKKEDGKGHTKLVIKSMQLKEVQSREKR